MGKNKVGDRGLKRLNIFGKGKDEANYLPVIVLVIAVLAVVGVGVYFALESGSKAEFEVTSLALSPAEAKVGQTVTVSAAVKNTGDSAGAHKVVLTIDGEEVEAKEVTLAVGETKTVTFTIMKDTEGTFTIGVGGLTKNLNVNPFTPATFEVSNLVVNPSEVEVGKPVVISATVKNVGDLEGTYTIELKINGVIEAIENITLAGGATETVSFTLIKNTAKTYNGSVNGLTGTFVVFEQPTLEVSYDKEYYYQEEIAHDTIRMTGVVHDGGMDVTVYYALYNPRGEQILEEPTGTVHHLQETGMTEPVEYTCHITILDTYPPGMYTEKVRVVDHISNQEVTNTTTFELIYDRPVNYQRYVQDELSEIVGLDLHPYGGHEEMTDERVYFIMWHEVDWKTYRYWAVEIDRESLEIARYEEIGNDGPNYGDLWWVPER